MNRRGFLSSIGAGLATLAVSTRLATASIKPAADFIIVRPEPLSIGGVDLHILTNGELRWFISADGNYGGVVNDREA